MGFKDCSEETDHNVILVRKPVTSLLALSLKGKATIGRHFTSPSQQYPKARGIVMLTSTGINKSTVIHEFGHILGLVHEHYHPDSKDEAQRFCLQYGQRQKEKEFSMIYTPFDEISVMNYCQILYDNAVGLSQGDVEHIRVLYRLSAIRGKRDF